MKTEVEQVNISDLGLWFGRMYPELLVQTKAQTSEQYCKKQSASSVKKPPIFLCLKTVGRRPAPLLEWGGDWSIAWRVLDAQFWGVPQRRRRIALIADFGGTTAPEILFERESVSGDFTQSGEQGQASTGHSETGVGDTGTAGLAYCIQGNCIDRADNAGCNGKGWREDKSYTLNTVDRPAVAVFENHSQDTRFKGPVDVSQTVSSTFGMGGNNTPFVVNKETMASFKSKMGAKAGNIGYAEDLAPTLSATQIDASVIAPSGFSQAAYDKFNADDKTTTLKAQGGSYGGGQ